MERRAARSDHFLLTNVFPLTFSLKREKKKARKEKWRGAGKRGKKCVAVLADKDKTSVHTYISKAHREYGPTRNSPKIHDSLPFRLYSSIRSKGAVIPIYNGTT